MRKEKDIIEIKEEVKIGNVILEVGDKVEVLKEKEAKIEIIFCDLEDFNRFKEDFYNYSNDVIYETWFNDSKYLIKQLPSILSKDFDSIQTNWSKKYEKNIIEIEEEVKIGNMILEEGDRIKILSESRKKYMIAFWRLPNQEELNLMYKNLHKKGIGGFASDYYWSSSEGSSVSAWTQNFNSGGQYYANKGNHYHLHIRVVRTFTSEDFFEIGEETENGFVFDIQGTTVFECKKYDEPTEMNWYEAMSEFGA